MKTNDSRHLAALAVLMYEPNNTKMDKFCLLKLADFLSQLDSNLFTNEYYRQSKRTVKSHIIPNGQKADCIGWSASLEDEKFISQFLFDDGAIDFTAYSESRFGLRRFSAEWEWCFSSKWRYVQDDPVTASRRIRYLVEKGLPNNWKKMLDGSIPTPFDFRPNGNIYQKFLN